MISRNCFAALLGLVSLPAAFSAMAAETGWTADLRYRHEQVRDEAFARDARADTLRLRLGYQGEFRDGLSAGIELEGVAAADARFNSTANGRAGYPVVADPDGLELNQAWLRWRIDHAGTTIGRQRLLLDNQRFIGNVGWRQNEQTFDAVVVDATPRNNISLRYAWLDRVHRVSGDGARDPLARERRLDAHLANASWKGGAGTVVGYGYWLEDEDVAAASTRTLGLRWTGSRPLGGATLGWSLELARQRDHAANPFRIDAPYSLIEPSLTARGLSWKLGRERLGGDGATAFQTPLATLHAFNGWADKFTVTPAKGLDDRYVSVSGKTGAGKLQDRLAWTLAFHDFSADRGGADYGREWNASLAFPLPGGLTGMVKLADYRSGGFARDTRKLWFQLEWAHPRR